MTLAQALLYFLGEACVSLIRSWKVSLLAVLTIGVSLFVSGIFLVVGGNLARVAEEWHEETRLIVYFHAASPAAQIEGVREGIERTPWVASVDLVSAAAAEDRFREIFPSMTDLLEGWGEHPLVDSLEVQLEGGARQRSGFVDWLTALRSDPAVMMVDDDRDWLARLEVAIAILRTVGVGLGAVLLGAAIFTIASVVRLTAYLYREEIAVMRLVGATEFYIRGPFYVEGLLQGVLGGLLALAGLTATFHLVRPAGDVSSIAWSLLSSEFLTWRGQLLLPLVGAVAGLAGAAVSLRREALGAS